MTVIMSRLQRPNLGGIDRSSFGGGSFHLRGRRGPGRPRGSTNKKSLLVRTCLGFVCKISEMPCCAVHRKSEHHTPIPTKIWEFYVSTHFPEVCEIVKAFGKFTYQMTYTILALLMHKPECYYLHHRPYFDAHTFIVLSRIFLYLFHFV